LKTSLFSKKPVKAFFYIVPILLYMIILWHFNGTAPRYQRYSSSAGAYVRYEKAQVTDIIKESLQRDENSGLFLGIQEVNAKILSGEHNGEIVSIRNTLSYTNNIRARQGLQVIVCIDTADKEHYNVWIYNYNRGPYIFFLSGLFILVLCITGGKRGLRSVIGILFTMSGIIFLFIPMLYRGYSPISASVGLVIITSFVTLSLLGGAKAKTLSAFLGTLAGMTISGAFLALSLAAMHLSGYNTGESDILIQLANVTHMKSGELLFAAIFISSFGAVVDIAISIASAIWEIYITNRSTNVKNLFKSGMNVGRDMMGTMANTLIIAFTGASLNLLILLRTMDVQYNQLLNTNLIGIYIIEIISGSIAVILTVPLVSIISAKLTPLLNAKKKDKAIPENPALSLSK
jgi:uncharacterized membrane protein